MSRETESTPILSATSDILEFGSFVNNRISPFEINTNCVRQSNDLLESTITGIDILHLSKQRILRPMKALQCLIGWRTCLTKNYDGDAGKYQKAFSIMYLSLFIFLLLISYIHEIIDCISISQNQTCLNVTKPLKDFINLYVFKIHKSQCSAVCHHMGTTYILPNVLHFLAYLLGLYWYHQQGIEKLCGVLEKVLTYLSTSPATKRSPKHVLYKLEIVSFGGICILALSLCNNTCYTFLKGPSNFHFVIFKLFNNFIIKRYLDNFLMVLAFIGYLVTNLVTSLLLIKFILYCDLLYFYCCALLQQLMMRVILIKEAKQEIYSIHTLVLHLNQTMGIITTIILLMLASDSVMNIKIILGYGEITLPDLVCQSINLILCLSVILVTIYQAIKVNKIIKRLSLVSLKMSTYGYQNVSGLDLQSFLLFTMGNKFHVELFSVPMREKYFIFLTILIVILFVILINFGAFNKIKIFSKL